MKKTKKYQLMKRAVCMWCREQPALFGSTALYALLNAVIPYITLWFTAQILNELAGTRQRGLLIQKIVALLAAESVLLLLKAAALRWNHTLSDGFCMKLYEWKRHFDKLLSMDFCDMENPQTHELLNAVQQTSHWSSFGMRMVYYQFQNFLEAVFQLIGGIALSVSLFRLPVRQEAGWLVMLNHPVCIVLVALLLAGVTALSPYLETISTKCWIECDAECTLGNRFFSFLYNLMSEPKRALDVRLYRQDIFFDQITSIQDSYGTKSKAARYARGKAGAACAASVAVSKIFIGLIYLFVCIKAWGGAFGIGSVTQYVGAITALSGGLAKILEIVGEAGINAFYLEREFSFMDIPNQMYQGSLTVEKRADQHYEVEFRNVSFRYPNAENFALKNISMKFKVGQRLAVVGQNGSGKTTFIKLLCRLYDPTEGQILLNGIDIRKYDYREYMRVFSVVFQDFHLLAFSVGQNIAARESYDRERAQSCCQKAGVWQRVASMASGMDTVLYKDLSEKGRLSENP